MHASDPTSSNALSRGLENLIFGARPVVLLLFAAATAVALYFALQLRVDAGFKKQIPLDHEYMQTFLDYEAEFGGANRVLVALVAQQGDIFTPQFFTELKHVTDEVTFLPAVDRTQVHSYCFRLKGAPEGMFEASVRFVSTNNSREPRRQIPSATIISWEIRRV